MLTCNACGRPILRGKGHHKWKRNADGTAEHKNCNWPKCGVGPEEYRASHGEEMFSRMRSLLFPEYREGMMSNDSRDTNPQSAGSLGKVSPDFSRVITTHEVVDHPPHYGGAESPYEAIKVIEAWGLGFCLGNAVKYISRAGKKHAPVPVNIHSDSQPFALEHAKRVAALEDLRKAAWYLNREIESLSKS